jgi:hypothetical protein
MTDNPTHDLTTYGLSPTCQCECEPEGRPGMFRCIKCGRLHPESVLEQKDGKWVMWRFEGKQRRRR